MIWAFCVPLSIVPDGVAEFNISDVEGQGVHAVECCCSPIQLHCAPFGMLLSYALNVILSVVVFRVQQHALPVQIHGLDALKSMLNVVVFGESLKCASERNRHFFMRPVPGRQTYVTARAATSLALLPHLPAVAPPITVARAAWSGLYSAFCVRSSHDAPVGRQHDG